MNMMMPYVTYPMGDTAVTIDYGNNIDPGINAVIMALYRYLIAHPLPGITDLVPAYSSLTLFYDPVVYRHEIGNGIAVHERIAMQLKDIIDKGLKEDTSDAGLIRVPVCYEEGFAPDLPELCAYSGLSAEEVIRLHTANEYRVYMLGFLPGFAYMGTVNNAIAMPRKPRPQTITAGSVGIAGKQTGIYPMASPGGWQIIGRTPCSLFDVTTGHTLFQPGDRVQFYPISSYEFDHY